MKIVIVETREDMGVSTISLNSVFDSSWKKGLVEYEIDEYVIETLLDQQVWGWVNGKDRFGEAVKRTYMLIEE